MVDPLTGVYAALAQGEVVGAKYAVEEINKKGGILGRPVELLVEDSANDVGTGVQKTRKLIERDQVSFIIGDVNSGIAIAMAQVTSEKKVLHVVSGGHSDVVTGSSCSWNVFRVCNSTTMDSAAIAQTLIEKFGKKWYFLTPDYAYGHSVQAALEKILKAARGTSAGPGESSAVSIPARISAAPTHCRAVSDSPSTTTPAIPANTGSMTRITAVRVGDTNRCASAITQNAPAEASTAVISTPATTS